jgi:SAM-dependent methyltransferase
VLTVSLDRLGIGPRTRVLDVGCGAGRHAIALAREGCLVVAVDVGTEALAAARRAEEETAFLAGPAPRRISFVRGDATRLPLADDSVDCAIASEVLEHLPDDGAALAELARVVRPGGLLAVTVPRLGPERICWALDPAYHAAAGGHVRIYRKTTLRRVVEARGFRCVGSHHAHALHTPYWWLRCALGVDRESRAVRLYHRLLVWNLMHRPRTLRWLERLLDPLIGKSLVLYFVRSTDPPAVPPRGGEEGRTSTTTPTDVEEPARALV